MENRIAVLLSGNGTTLQNLIDKSTEGNLHANVSLVISNKASAYGLERARKAGIPCEVVPRKLSQSVESFSDKIFEFCDSAEVNLLCLAGFLQKLVIPPRWENRVMNVHPSLIPAFSGHGFYGHHVHEAVLGYGAKITGCTVHFVNNDYDNGPIILQEAIRVLPDDSTESLAQRVQELERRIYPEAINLYQDQRLQVIGRKVLIRGFDG